MPPCDSFFICPLGKLKNTCPIESFKKCMSSDYPQGILKLVMVCLLYTGLISVLFYMSICRGSFFLFYLTIKGRLIIREYKAGTLETPHVEVICNLFFILFI